MRQCADPHALVQFAQLSSLFTWYQAVEQRGRRETNRSTAYKRPLETLGPLSSNIAVPTPCVSEKSSSKQSTAGQIPAAGGEAAPQKSRKEAGLPEQPGRIEKYHYAASELPLERAVGAGQGTQAYQHLQELQQARPGALPRDAVCGKLLEVLSKGRDFRKCWNAYQRLRGSQLRYTALANVMNAAIRAKEPYLAVEVFRDMQTRSYKPNLTSWCFLISSLSKTGKRNRPAAETAYAMWQELQTQNKDVLEDADASLYATGMMACVGVGRLPEARRLLDEMRGAGFTPDIRVFNILLKGCTKQAEVDRIPELLSGIKKARLEPSATTYNTLIDAYVNAGRLTQARETVEEAKAKGVSLDLYTYSTLLKGFVGSEMLSEASSLVDEMEAARIHPNTVTLTTLLDGFVKVGRMDEAEKIISSMKRKQAPANIITYNILLRGYAFRGDLQAVRDVLRRMGEAGVHPDSDTFNTLMDGALDNNDPERVLQLFRQLVRLDLRPDSLSYTSLIIALGRLSRPHAAIEAFKQLEEDWGLCFIALNALISALANANMLDEAEEYLDKAISLAHQQDRAPPLEAYTAVLKAYARRKDVGSAMELFQEFEDQGGEPDDRLVNTAVLACLKARQFRRALQFLRTMERKGRDIDKARLKQTLEHVIRIQSQSWKVQEVQEVQKSENLERLKFWLGLPNRYYGSDNEA